VFTFLRQEKLHKTEIARLTDTLFINFEVVLSKRTVYINNKQFYLLAFTFTTRYRVISSVRPSKNQSYI